jgi:hypothetical protein
MSLAEDQHVVQALAVQGADRAFAGRAHARSLDSGARTQTLLLAAGRDPLPAQPGKRPKGQRGSEYPGTRRSGCRRVSREAGIPGAASAVAVPRGGWPCRCCGGGLASVRVLSSVPDSDSGRGRCLGRATAIWGCGRARRGSQWLPIGAEKVFEVPCRLVQVQHGLRTRCRPQPVLRSGSLGGQAAELAVSQARRASSAP